MEDGERITNQPTVAIATLGCKLNQAESEELARRFNDAGYCVVQFDESADVYVVNTCSVTHIADRKSRQLIRQARRANPGGIVVATGCYAEVAPQEVGRVDRVDLVVRNEDKGRIVEMVDERRMRRPPGQVGGLGVQLPSATSRTRALLKIQEGCNKFCAYCMVPLARGRERSRPASEVIADVNRLVAEGRKEVVLTGVNIGAYGRDSSGEPPLLDLVRRILDETQLPRLRLSSIEPEDFDPRIVSLMDGGRLARHLHLPLQSGSDQVLRLMRRRYSSQWFLSLVDEIRRAVPPVAITTDVIVGFPGEGEAEFHETCDLVRKARFAGIHVFKYSARRGTRAAQMPNQVPYTVKQQRSEALLQLGAKLGRSYREGFAGETLEVLYEEVASAERMPLGGRATTRIWEGLTDNYIRVFTPSERPLGNQIVPTRMIGEHPNGLWGSIESSELR